MLPSFIILLRSRSDNLAYRPDSFPFHIDLALTLVNAQSVHWRVMLLVIHEPTHDVLRTRVLLVRALNINVLPL